METMFRSGRLLVSALCLLVGMSGTGFAPAQQLGRVNSDHVTIELPAERELVGRGLIGDLERCYVYMNRSIGGALPRRVTVTLDWGAAENRCNRRAGHITIGLGRPGADAGGKDGIFHAIAREMQNPPARGIRIYSSFRKSAGPMSTLALQKQKKTGTCITRGFWNRRHPVFAWRFLQRDGPRVPV